MRVFMLILGMAAMVCGCSLQTEPTTTRKVFLVDVSDSLTSEINDVFDEDGIGYPEFTWNGHITRYGIIRNSSYAEVTEYTLPAANEYLSNTGSREQKIAEYIGQLATLSHADSTEYHGSLVWESFWNELVYLSQDSTMTTTVYLCSDLLEFNKWISFYLPKYRSMLTNDTEQVVSLFKERMKPLQYTNHIEVVIVHEPSIDTETNEFFTQIVERIYKPLLEEQGIPVSVRSKL